MGVLMKRNNIKNMKYDKMQSHKNLLVAPIVEQVI